MSEMKTIQNALLGESYTHICHDSGLNIYVLPKPFSTTYAMFGTRYGSIDSRFRLEGASEDTVVPDGIAHFLEHKMFENENGEDTFLRFARFGANANAYTSFDKTCYLFSCTDSFYESLEVLLDYVTHPYFTPQTVEKEQGIIGQEIRMGEDNPHNRLLYGMLGCLYENNPVKIDIAGTVESISQITAPLLYACYETFYNLHNMALCICGDVDAKQVVAVADRVLQKQAPRPIVRYRPSEAPTVFQKRYHAKMSVSAPLFSIGVKDVAISACPRERAKKRAALSILQNILFGKSSSFFNRLYESGMIKGNLDYWFEHNEAFSLLSLSGESDNPEAIYAEFVTYIECLKKEGLCRQSFERYRRVQYAEVLDIFDSTESVANQFIAELFDGADLLDSASYLEQVTYEDICALLNEIFCEDAYAMSVIEPLS